MNVHLVLVGGLEREYMTGPIPGPYAWINWRNGEAVISEASEQQLAKLLPALRRNYNAHIKGSHEHAAACEQYARSFAAWKKSPKFLQWQNSPAGIMWSQIRGTTDIEPKGFDNSHINVQGGVPTLHQPAAPARTVAEVTGGVVTPVDDGTNRPASATGSGHANAGNDGGNGIDANKAVREAVEGMDRNDAELWTGEGKPKVAVVAKLTGREDLTREAIDIAAPGVTRESVAG